MSYDGWLEKPYHEAIERAESDERARELGFTDSDEWYEAMREEAAERNAEIRADLEWERENDR